MANNPYDSPAAATAAPMTSSLRTVCLKRVDPISVAKIAGTLYAIIGLFVGGVFFLFSLVGVLANQGDMALGAVGGLVMMVVFPVIYGVLGFVGVLIGAVIFNLVASMVGVRSPDRSASGRHRCSDRHR